MVRTSNLREMDPDNAKIPSIMQKFFSTGMQAQISHRKNPGTLFACYTNYETNEYGEYTYFLGEEVDVFENIPQDFRTLIIPAQTYMKFTSGTGSMPSICIDMWQEIWKMKADDLGGERAYIADFEIYDERSRDPNYSVVDIWIGIQR